MYGFQMIKKCKNTPIKLLMNDPTDPMDDSQKNIFDKRR